MDFVTLEAKSHKGKNRITEARKRLPKWDGKTWRVVQEKKRVSFSSDPGPWAHVTPNTEDNTDWCSRWVNLREDDNFTVTANVKFSGDAPLHRRSVRVDANVRTQDEAMKPLYIFDLDGTLALIEHRRHFVERPSLKCYDCGGANRTNCVQCADLDAGWKADWRGFFAACADDAPNEPVIRTLQALRSGGAEVWIWSGRSDEVKAQTVEWLCKHGCMGNNPTGFLPAWPFGAPERFRMRKAGDHQDDVTLKSGWLAEIEPPEWARLTAVFDDRKRVVDMWRDAGVPCFQVAPGEF